MDKFEYRVRAEEIQALVDKKDYKQAAEIADTIDWRRVKSYVMLCTVSDIYKAVRRYDDSKALLLLADERQPNNRNIIYCLCELYVKLGDIIPATETYKHFCRIAPDDSRQYILKYKIFQLTDTSLEEQINVLEELKRHDFLEKWMYELAYLYHRIGLGTRCVEECDELITMFGTGKFVRKAMELKMLHEPLSREQQRVYNEESQAVRENPDLENTRVIPDLNKAMTKESTPAGIDTAPTKRITPEELSEIQVRTMDPEKMSTVDLQKEIARNLKEVMGPDFDTDPNMEIPVPEGLSEEDIEQSEIRIGQETGEISQTELLTHAAMAPLFQETKEMDMGPKLEPDAEEIFFEEPDTVDMSRDMEEVIEKTADAGKEIQDTVLQEMRQKGELREEAIRKQAQLQEGHTDQIVVEEVEKALEEEGAVQHHPRPDVVSTAEAQAGGADPYAGFRGTVIYPVKPGSVPESTAFDELLTQESDGQISLAVPESEQIEKQITGQISLDDIMQEWQSKLQANREKRFSELQKMVQDETGEMFTKYDVEVGLMQSATEAAASGIGEDVFAEDALLQDEEAASEEAVEETISEDDEADVTEDLSEETCEDIADTEEIAEEDVTDTDETVEEDAAGEEELPEAIAETAADIAEEDLAKDNATGDVAEDTDGAEESAEETQESAEDSEKETEDTAGEETTDGTDTHTEGTTTGTQEAAQGHIRGTLSPEERKLFAPFLQDAKSKRQLEMLLDTVSLAPYTGNVIITGEAGAGILKLVRRIVKDIQVTDHNFSGKVARTTAEEIKDKNMEKLVSKVPNGALIIEDAGALNCATAENLSKALSHEGEGIIIFLTDTKKGMDSLLKVNDCLKELFNARVDIEALDNDSLVSFGVSYAYDLEYAIDELGKLALHRRIEERQTSSHSVTVDEVKDIVREAVKSANRKNLKHFVDILFAKRYDAEDMIILRERDFL
ncbi:MAG: hypothetical protein K5682_07745 [Lachnospiraceae bacterium]|nr:hypothetical protein [Lachnospiraceae bacterium]